MPTLPNPLPTHSLRVGVAQAEAIRGDINANVATVANMLDQAAREGVRLLVFPEKFLSGYEPSLIAEDPHSLAIGELDPRLAPIEEACRRGNIAAVVGAASRSTQGLKITSLIFNTDGRQVARYHKQCLFGSERNAFQPGDEGLTLELDGWRLGMAVCYDCGFPEHARAAAALGCHAYVVSALFSVGNGYHESRTWLPARALDNTLYVLLSNHVGTTGGWNACGGSAIWGPLGHLIVEADSKSHCFVVADLDPRELAEARQRETMLIDLESVPKASFTKRTLHAVAG